MLHLNQQDLAIVKKIIQETLSEFEVFFFGSRVTGTNKTYSDLDIVIKSDKKINFKTMESIKDIFSLSDISIKVDILDWHSISDDFQKIILNNPTTTL